MIATHWQLPTAPLRASAVITTLTGLIAAIGSAELARAVLPLGHLYAVKAGACFAIIMLVAIGFLPRHHPFTRLGPANQITTLRAMLVALVAALYGEPRFPIVAVSAAATSLLVTALDGVDGWLARRHRMASNFGAHFDMEIDALLILVLAILVTQFEKAGPWVILSGLLRYIFVAAGKYWPRLRAPLAPSRRRQTICVVQILALTVAMLPTIQPPLSTSIAAAALVALAYSFLIDTLWLLNRAR
jgi:phosphatidylglycerophosphate synthase